MAPAAPGLFSTTTLWCRRSPSFCASKRPTTSVEPPTVNGTTYEMALSLGQSAAWAGSPAAASAAAARVSARWRRRIRFMSCLRVVGVGVERRRRASAPVLRAPRGIAFARGGIGGRVQADDAAAGQHFAGDEVFECGHFLGLAPDVLGRP